MTQTITRPGTILDVGLTLGHVSTNETTTLIRTENLKVIRIALQLGHRTSMHVAPGEVTLLCLAGKLALLAQGKNQEVPAGHLVYLAPGEPHALEALADSTALLTVLERAPEAHRRVDPVEEALEETFPASDPPANTPITGA